MRVAWEVGDSMLALTHDSLSITQSNYSFLFIFSSKSIHEDHVFDEIGDIGGHDDNKQIHTEQAPPQPPPKAKEEGDDSQEEQEGENSDGEEFMVFYDKAEIDSTKNWQEHDMFDELVTERLNCVDFTSNQTKIDIL